MNNEKKEQKNKEKKEKYTKEIKDLVIARLLTIPPNASLSVGESEDSSTKDIKELIEHVQKGDEVGEEIIETQLDYIRSLRDLPLTLKEYESPDH